MLTFATGFVMQYVFGIQWAMPVTAGADLGFIDLPAPWCSDRCVDGLHHSIDSLRNLPSNIAEDYVRTGHVLKVCRTVRVMLRHVLRNSLIPVVTYLGQDIGALMAAMITEQISTSTASASHPLRARLTWWCPSSRCLRDLRSVTAVDLLYAALDPRIRYAKREPGGVSDNGKRNTGG